MRKVDIAFLEMSFVALRNIQSLPQPFHATSAVTAITLEISMAQTVLLLQFLDDP